MKYSENIPDIIEKVLPAVVSITASKIINENNPLSRQGFLFFPEKRTSIKKEVKIGGGSGFIIDESGIVVTNKHVIGEDGEEFDIFTQDGRKFPGEIIEIDKFNDIAFLKIKGNNFPTIKLGNSLNLRLGETVIAVGNTLGVFQNTVSVGVISGLSREITAVSQIGQENIKLRGLIQTDAAINPGNSGGPLINMKGEAIGINIATVLGAENVGFAFPINVIKKDLKDIKKYGRIREPFLGIRYLLLNKEIKEKFKLPVERGALILPELGKKGVLPNSPGEKAGLKEGDIILEIGGKKVTEKLGPIEIIQNFEVGKKIKISIWRNGNIKKLEIIPEERK